MANWFADIKDLKTNAVGGAVASTMNISSAQPSIDSAERDYLVPALGATTLALIKSEIGILSPSPDQIMACKLLKKAVGYLGVYNYLKFGGVEFGEGGLLRVETADKKTAYRRQENDFREGLRKEGFEAIEEAFLFLEANLTYSTAFKLTATYKAARAVFTYSAGLMREQYDANVSRDTFNALRATLVQAHIFEVKKLLPAQFYAWIKNIHDTATPDADQSTVIDYLKKIETYYAIESAMYRNLVKLNGTDVVITERAYAEDGGQQQKLPPLDVWRVANSYHREVAITYTKLLREFVETNKTLFPTAISTDIGGTNADADAWLPVLTDTEICDNEAVQMARHFVEM